MVQIDQKLYGASMQRLTALFDAGSFVELGAYTKRPSSQTEFESVVCGYGAVKGRLTFAFAQDSGRMRGAFGERHAKKIANLYALAVKNGAPIIGLFDSAGAVVYDGAEALSAYGIFMKCVSEASGVVPQIALVSGICGGSSAVVASMFDFVVTVKDTSKLYINSPFVVGEELAESGFAAAKGSSAFEGADEAEALAFVKSLLDMIPANNSEGAVSESMTDDLNRRVAFDLDGSAEDLVKTLADGGVAVSLYSAYSASLYAGFARFGGVAAGVLCSEGVKGGKIDLAAARVAARMISFCDSFRIPLVTLINSEGLETSLEAEAKAYASELARLAMAYATSENPKISVVTGKAYGAAFTLLGSKTLGADLAYALPTACISVLSPEASVAFVWNDKVGEKTREEVEAEWREKVACAADAADCGAIDDVIEPEETRKRICAALAMLSYKAEGTPERRHAVLPL